MSFIDAIVGPVSKLLDKIVPDPEARDRAKLELIKLQGDQEMAAIGAQMQAIVVEAQSADPWTSRARRSVNRSLVVKLSPTRRRPRRRKTP